MRIYNQYSMFPYEVLIFSAMLIDLCNMGIKQKLIESIDTCTLEYYKSPYKNHLNCIAFNTKKYTIKSILDEIASQYNLLCVNIDDKKVYYTFWYYPFFVTRKHKEKYLRRNINVILKFINLNKLIYAKSILFSSLLFQYCLYIINCNCNLYDNVIECKYYSDNNYYDLKHVGL